MTNCAIRGNSGAFGGGLEAFYGTATVTNCTINSAATRYRRQRASGGLPGFNFNTTTVTNCTISGNFGLAGSSGGGLQTEYGTTTVTQSAPSAPPPLGFVEQAVPAWLNYDDNTTLTDCTISGNASGLFGGGVGNTTYGGTTTLINCTVSGNSQVAAKGLANQGPSTLIVSSCNISNNKAVGGRGACDWSSQRHGWNNGGSCSPTVISSALTGETVAIGGAGASGNAGGDGIGGGLAVENKRDGHGNELHVLAEHRPGRSRRGAGAGGAWRR